MGTTLQDLAFLAGAWAGEGMVMQFGQPIAGQLFGSLQAVEGDRTLSWETLRFAEEDDELVMYGFRQDAPLGRFVLTQAESQETPRFRFEDPSGERDRVRNLACSEAKDSLLLGLEGEVDGAPFRREWLLWKKPD